MIYRLAILFLKAVGSGAFCAALGAWVGMTYGMALGKSIGMRSMFTMIEQLREAPKPPPPFTKGDI